jgi:hypothetical protein
LSALRRERARDYPERLYFVLFEDFATRSFHCPPKDNERGVAPEVLFPAVLAPTLWNVHPGGFI